MQGVTAVESEMRKSGINFPEVDLGVFFMRHKAANIAKLLVEHGFVKTDDPLLEHVVLE